MTYTLAKELEDAGFPKGGSADFLQSERGEVCGRQYETCKDAEKHHDECDDWDCKKTIQNCDVYAPTLSELIDACGRGFGILACDIHNFEREDEKWFAGKDDCGDNCPSLRSLFETHGVGKTPEEAVANLWLLLNRDKIVGNEKQTITKEEGEQDM